MQPRKSSWEGEQPMSTERAIEFECEGESLYGILHEPAQPAKRGLLIIVGGPQYRVGSHRQFVLLARQATSAGIPVLRFDYRGMGDSEGQPRNFEEIGADIRCAIDAFCRNVPSVEEIVLWGLCDAASAALFYAYQDVRVTGLVLLNPWTRTEQGMARSYLRHYYLVRLLDLQVWLRVWKRQFDFVAAARSLGGMMVAAVAPQSGKGAAGGATVAAVPSGDDLPTRMALGFQRFEGHVLVILSGDDLTAAEFRDVVTGSRLWRRLMRRPTVSLRELPDANHTFARRDWRDQVSALTAEWIGSW